MAASAEMELQGKTALITGVSPGIGSAIAHRLAAAGARILAADLNAELAEKAAEELNQAFGEQCALAATADCTSRASMQALVKQCAHSLGGPHILICTAAVFYPPDETGRTTEKEWMRTLEINLLGSYIAADEAGKQMQTQQGGGSIVLLSSANALVPKKGSMAYDTGKAALNHLVRELAVEYAPRVRVNAVAPASVVEGSLQFPRERVLSSLKKYGIEHTEEASTQQLRTLLADYYAQRTLLQKRVTPDAVAEAVFLMASSYTACTTGHIFPVDAGLAEAFLR